MAAAPNGGIMDLYPGTFNARSTRSFKDIFEAIRRRVERRVFGYETPSTPIPMWDVIDLLSGHRTYIQMQSVATSMPIDVQLPSTMWVDEKTRLLLSDMATGAEPEYVIDRLSRRAREWAPIAVQWTGTPYYTLVIHPGATKGLHTSLDPDYFACFVKGRVKNPHGQPAIFGDISIQVSDAATYAFVRAPFEPEIAPEYTHVLLVRMGLRTLITGIDAQTAQMFGGVGSQSMDIARDVWARRLVPAV